MLSLASRAAIILAAAVPALCHNYVVCTNAVDVPLEELLSEKDRPDIQNIEGTCKGYPRAWPGDDTPAGANRNDQAWPWQNIWPLTDGAALRNHRVCNWAQENPTYAPGYDVATVKPGSTLMMLTQTNNHVHEYADRPSGHYKIFLAGPSGTQLTTANQLTFDRVIFSAPSNKYAHVIGQPNFAGYFNDPGYAYLPVKMVDPKGNYLPPGTYNFVFAYFWSTDKPSLVDYMIPDYSTSFDVVIDPASDDAGSLTKCVNTNPDCANYLVGKTSSPGAKDTTSPWPPYPDNYLFTNFDGDDPSTPNGKRTFQSYWQKFVPSTKMPAISTKAPVDIKSRNEEELLEPIPVAGGAMMPEDVKEYPSMPAGAGESIQIVQKLAPISVDGATDGGQTETVTDITDEPGSEKPVTHEPVVEEVAADKPVETKSKKLRNRRKHRKYRNQQRQAN